MEGGDTSYRRSPVMKTKVSGKLFRQRGLALRILPIRLNFNSRPVHWLCLLIGSSVQSKKQCSALLTVCLARTWKSIYHWPKGHSKQHPCGAGCCWPWRSADVVWELGLGRQNLLETSEQQASLLFSLPLKVGSSVCSRLRCLMLKEVQNGKHILIGRLFSRLAAVSYIGSIQEDIFLNNSTSFSCCNCWNGSLSNPTSPTFILMKEGMRTGRIKKE